MDRSSEQKRSLLTRILDYAQRQPSIFGSDVFVDYTLAYIWQANQVGHIALGLIWGSLSVWLVTALSGSGLAVYLAGGAIIPIYVFKEYIDFLLARRQARDFIPYDKSELRADMAADSWFVISGALTILAAYASPWLGILSFFALNAGSFLVLRKIFLPAKRSLDQTGLPYIFRIANFPQTEGVHTHNASRIDAFIKDTPVDEFEPSKAVLIQGFGDTGKTTLAIAIGAEIAVRKREGGKARAKVLYRSAFSFFDKSEPPKDSGVSKIRSVRPEFISAPRPWTLDEAEYVIIDDVDSGSDLYGGEGPEQILKQLEQNGVAEKLKQKKTVWVTGTPHFDKPHDPHGWSKWHEALTRFYGYEVNSNPKGDGPAAIQAKEPIPVIWLRQKIDVVSP